MGRMGARGWAAGGLALALLAAAGQGRADPVQYEATLSVGGKSVWSFPVRTREGVPGGASGSEARVFVSKCVPDPGGAPALSPSRYESGYEVEVAPHPYDGLAEVRWRVNLIEGLDGLRSGDCLDRLPSAASFEGGRTMELAVGGWESAVLGRLGGKPVVLRVARVK